MKNVVVRTENAGAFFGKLESHNGNEATLCDARRLWYWSGASSLSEIAMKGVSNPEGCKFPCKVDRIELVGVIEVIDATEEAAKNIDEVPVWTQH